jgi:hypothetical protein
VKPEKGKSKGRQQEEEEKVERRGKSKKGKKWLLKTASFIHFQ